ncbi:MAG TPA: hypothetical protein DEQ43_15920 [Nocardioides bacterium]|nr:hypothetical protein [Nocardioides sp.]
MTAAPARLQVRPTNEPVTPPALNTWRDESWLAPAMVAPNSSAAASGADRGVLTSSASATPRQAQTAIMLNVTAVGSRMAMLGVPPAPTARLATRTPTSTPACTPIPTVALPTATGTGCSQPHRGELDHSA